MGPEGETRTQSDRIFFIFTVEAVAGGSSESHPNIRIHFAVFRQGVGDLAVPPFQLETRFENIIFEWPYLKGQGVTARIIKNFYITIMKRVATCLSMVHPGRLRHGGDTLGGTFTS